jgi:CPA1 family monovalent cation:H+ antiporter
VVLGTPLAAALLFGALISATDPVAVVAVFRELGVLSGC